MARIKGGFEVNNAKGMREKGNLDPYDRPILQNPDGSYSTTSSISIGEDKGEVLIPTVVNGVRLSDEDAITHYHQTGEHFGVFDTPENADAYATDLHNAQATHVDEANELVQTTAAYAGNIADAFNAGYSYDELQSHHENNDMGTPPQPPIERAWDASPINPEESWLQSFGSQPLAKSYDPTTDLVPPETPTTIQNSYDQPTRSVSGDAAVPAPEIEPGQEKTGQNAPWEVQPPSGEMSHQLIGVDVPYTPEDI